jgi:hypothetical protein
MGSITEESVFNFRQGQNIFLFSTASRMAWVPTHSPIHWILGALSPWEDSQGEADHSPPSSAKVKNTFLHMSS